MMRRGKRTRKKKEVFESRQVELAMRKISSLAHRGVWRMWEEPKLKLRGPRGKKGGRVIAKELVGGKRRNLAFGKTKVSFVARRKDQ